jgi:hypothetical protein
MVRCEATAHAFGLGFLLSYVIHGLDTWAVCYFSTIWNSTGAEIADLATCPDRNRYSRFYSHTSPLKS